jgi:AraC family transcriptional regulator
LDYYDLVSQSIDYIERNLTNKITLRDIAASANLSVSHLYRVFPALTGHTVGQYIRKRRLSEAAGQLKGFESTIGIALEYQFETQEGFIRSFKALFGVTPGEYRRHPTTLPLYRRADITRQKGEMLMQPNMIVRQFTLIGMESEIDLNAEFSDRIQELTGALKLRLPEIVAENTPARIINLWYMKFNETNGINEPATYFFTGIEAAENAAPPSGMTLKKLPSSLFAVFGEKQRGTVGGPDGYAYRRWLPESGYALNEEIPGDFEVYPDSVHIGYDDECEIYIPVCKM